MRELHSRLIYRKLLSFVFIYSLIVPIYGQITLKVTDEKNLPLIGVEVFNNDFSFTEISNSSGYVIIPSEFAKDKLTLKYLGFKKQTIDFSQETESEVLIRMVAKQELLDEVILIGRNDMRTRDFLQRVDAIQDIDLKRSNPQTTADALSRNADVYIQKSQMGGGSPVIRGFEANKVLLVVDGVRMNNAIYRNGHLQNAITIDNSILDQMEVIYGPSSLMYGSDALGGVIHFRTKDPILNLSDSRKSNVFGNYFLRYGSANQEKSVHVDANIGFRKWGMLTSITYSDFEDLRMGSRRTADYPDYGNRSFFQNSIVDQAMNNDPAQDRVILNSNPNVQVGTAYNQFDLLQKFRYQINDRMNLTANIQHSTSSDIPRYDQLVLREGDQFEFAEWYYGPQDRTLYSLKYKWTENKAWMDELIVIASRQLIEESRIQRRFMEQFRSVGIENVGVSAFTVDVNKEFDGKRRHHLYYGGDFQYNTVNSMAWNQNVIGDFRDENVFTRYPSGGSKMSIGGLYVQYINSSLDSIITVHGGLRLSTFTTKVNYLESDPIQWPSYFYEGVNATNSALSWSMGINWNPNRNWTIRLLSSSAFRAPNVDDIGKLRINNDNVVVPNPDLLPETSTNGEVNISRRLGKVGTFSSTIFYTYLRNAIVRQNFSLPDGSTTFVDGNNTFNVEANVNAEQAELYGVSLNIKLRLHANLNFESALSYIRGQVLNEEAQPLSHIPPMYGRTQLRYTYNQWGFTFLSQYNANKPLELYGGSVDNPEYATPEGALGWTIFNIYSEYRHKNYTFQLGVENILDKHYLPFASGVSGPGRNLILAVRGNF